MFIVNKISNLNWPVCTFSIYISGVMVLVIPLESKSTVKQHLNVRLTLFANYQISIHSPIRTCLCTGLIQIDEYLGMTKWPVAWKHSKTGKPVSEHS